MDALDLLEQQHREVRELLEQLSFKTGKANATQRLEQLVRVVEAHLRVEDAYVYIACASKLRGEERATQANDVRMNLLSALHALHDAAPTDPQFRTNLTTLIEHFACHVDLEEDVVFPRLKRTLTDEALDVLGEAIAHAHKRLMADDKPWLEVDEVRLARRTVRGAREPISRRCAILRSGVRPKIRPAPAG